MNIYLSVTYALTAGWFGLIVFEPLLAGIIGAVLVTSALATLCWVGTRYRHDD